MGTMTGGVVQGVSQASSAAILILCGSRSEYDGRKTIICGHCGRAQFNKGQAACVACRATLLLALEPLGDFDAPRPPAFTQNVSVGTMACTRLRDLRKILQLSQPELAAKVGCARIHISKYECGWIIPTIAFLDRLANGLNITLAELLDDAIPLENLAVRSLLRSPGDGDLMQVLVSALAVLQQDSRRAITVFAESLGQRSPLAPARRRGQRPRPLP